jgi:PAS domain S-box-containing protein
VLVGLGLLGIADVHLGVLAAGATTMVAVQGLLWLLPHRGWDRRLPGDQHDVYTPMLGSALLFGLYATAAPGTTELLFMAWFASLLFLTGLAGFWAVFGLSATMAASVLAGTTYAAPFRPVDPTRNLTSAAVFLVVMAYAGFVFERLRRERAERIQLRRERERAIESASAEAERYQGLFDGIPVGLYSTSASGEIIEANPALLRLLGYASREESRTVNTAAIHVDPEDRRRWQALIEQEGVVRNFEVRLRRHDGVEIWALDNARAIRDESGCVVGFQGSLEDITARKQGELALRDANARLRETVAQLDRQTREAGALREMGDFLQASSDLEEAYDIVVHAAERLFPGISGMLCTQTPSRYVVEAVRSWGETVTGERVFAPGDCWAIRRGSPHQVTEGPSGRCAVTCSRRPRPATCACRSSRRAMPSACCISPAGPEIRSTRSASISARSRPRWRSTPRSRSPISGCATR